MMTMTDKNLTNNEIIKTLEGAILNAKRCDSKVWSIEVSKLEYVLDLTNRQQEEIEALITGQETLQKYIAKAKAEAVKEITERLKNKIKTECNPYGAPTFDYDTSIKILNFIDNLVKGMAGEEE